MKENKLFQGHEAARKTAEAATKRYEDSLADIGGKVASHKSGTEAMEDAHYGRKAANEGRKK